MSDIGLYDKIHRRVRAEVYMIIHEKYDDDSRWKADSQLSWKISDFLDFRVVEPIIDALKKEPEQGRLTFNQP